HNQYFFRPIVSFVTCIWKALFMNTQELSLVSAVPLNSMDLLAGFHLIILVLQFTTGLCLFTINDLNVCFCSNCHIFHTESFIFCLTEKILGASVKPSTTLIDEGTSINLTCEASGSIWTRMWKKDGSDLILADNMTLSENNRLLSFNPVNRNDNGEYFCNVSNPISSDGAKYNLVPISNVTLNVNQTELMEFNSSAELTCSVSSGSSFSYLWMNGSSEVSATGRLQLTDGGSTLTVVNVTRYDQGPFRCCDSVNLINICCKSPLTIVQLKYKYGPDNMALTVNGQNTTSFSAGSNLTILCSSQSNPPAQLQWAFRGELVNVTGPLLELSHVGEDQSGPYSCLSGSDQHAVNMLLLSLLLAGFLFS
uniref:Ig-like domain-containing protein n=1 Tax=Amphiprion ocellaris TaxID=80972 RepID=A0AAQ5XC55_AMPOC